MEQLCASLRQEYGYTDCFERLFPGHDPKTTVLSIENTSLLLASLSAKVSTGRNGASPDFAGYLAIIRNMQKNARSEKLVGEISKLTAAITSIGCMLPQTAGISAEVSQEVSQELSTDGIPPQELATDYASWYEANTPAVSAWIDTQKPSESTVMNICSYLAAHGLVELLDQYLGQNRKPWEQSAFIYKYAIKSGSIDVLKILRKHGFQLHDSLTLTAIREDRINILKWLYQEGSVMNGCDTKVAAECGRLEILKWLFELRCNISDVVAAAAVENKHSHILEYLLEKQCPINTDTLSVAIKSGMIKITISKAATVDSD